MADARKRSKGEERTWVWTRLRLRVKTQLATGNWQLATGNWQLATIDSCRAPSAERRAPSAERRAPSAENLRYGPCTGAHATATGENSMSKLLRGLAAGYGAKKLGGGCFSTILIFIILWWLLGNFGIFK
jgi:hypothetical protein